jgi:hypothetical protein
MSSAFAKTIEAKSDQLNSDDLMAGPITVTITDVKVNENTDQQPVSISFTGDNGKPWKPSKSMRRALMLKWGSDEKAFIGRSLTLFRDPTIRWAGQEVGGVSISHMTDMADDSRFLLTSSRGQKKAMKIERLKMKSAEEQAEERKNRASTWVSQSKLEIKELDSAEAIEKWKTDNTPAMESLGKYEDLLSELADFINASIGDFNEDTK